MFKNAERGYVLIYTLLLLLFTVTICLTMHGLALLEYKMGLYEFRANQARELAESAAWMALEEINGLLRDQYSYTEELPAVINLGNDWGSVFDEDKAMRISYAAIAGQDDNSCTYHFESCGTYKGANNKLDVQVVLRFEDVYTLQFIEGDWYLVFSYRDYLDRGRFAVFKEIE